MSPESNN